MKTFFELREAKATYCGRCGTTHVPPSQGGTCPALSKEESVKTADKKPETYTDPNSGKTKTRMVPVDKEVVKEKTLTPAEKKKREEIAKAMERENPGMDMSKKMAIATAAAKRVAEAKKEYAPGHIGAIQKMLDKEREAKKAKDAMKKEEFELDEALGTAAKYAGKSGVFGGKYTSSDHMMGMKNFSAIRDKRAKQRDAEHQKQDPKHAAAGYAKHMVDTDKAKKKAAKRGVDASHLNWRHTNGLKQEAFELEEGITKMSNARLKYHATKNFPHGSYTRKEIEDEHKRRQKTEPNYHTVKPALESKE